VAEHRSFWSSSQGLAALVLIGAVTYFLLMEHRAHLFQALPFMILLLCPAMHIFMHKGHSGHGDSDTDDDAAYQRGLEEGRKQALEKSERSRGDK
jgi:choline-glycine betaine transporter